MPHFLWGGLDVIRLNTFIDFFKKKWYSYIVIKREKVIK